MNNIKSEEEIREEWNDAFLPEVPSMIKSAEVKNADGSYSCITCGIKKESIADWWLGKIAQIRKADLERLRGVIISEIGADTMGITSGLSKKEVLENILTIITSDK